MKSLIISCLFSVVLAGPQYYPGQYQRPNYYQQQQPQLLAPKQQYYGRAVPILSEYNEVNTDGSFKYGYQSGDGQQVQAEGYLKNAGYKEEAETVQGGFSYVSPEGKSIVTKYVADENGYRAEGAHIPTPPPIPAAILRSLEYNARNPSYDDQSEVAIPKYRPLQPIQPQPYRPSSYNFPAYKPNKYY